MSKRPQAPAAIKRLLRNESGYGCCVCGNPIIQYHHIIPWEREHHFRPEDMMTLCPNHHTMATQGAYQESDQRKHKANPRNIKKGLVKGRLFVNQGVPVVILGSVDLIGEGPIFTTGKKKIFSIKFDNGSVLISLFLQSRESKVVCEILENEWLSEYPFPWDIDWRPKQLIIREEKGKINLNFNTKNQYLEIKGVFPYNDSSIHITSDMVLMSGAAKVSFRNLTLVNSNFVLKKKSIVHKPNTGKKPQIISWPDRNERIRRGIDAWKKLKSV